MSLTWKRKEIENYLCSRATLLAYACEGAEDAAPGPLFSAAEAQKRAQAMDAAIAEIESALEKLGKGSPWDKETKVSDDFLDPLFRAYFKKLRLPNLMAKSNFYELARHVPLEEVDVEIEEKLDAIVATAHSATPRKE
jgi:hypothetical protein